MVDVWGNYTCKTAIAGISPYLNQSLQEVKANSPSEFTFQNPNFTKLGEHIIHNASYQLPFVEQNAYIDCPEAIICATGPTLEDAIPEIKKRQKKGAKIFAIKEAIREMRSFGIPPDFSVAMDPDAAQVDKTPLDPEVLYFVASSCHPVMFDYLLDAGMSVEVFHSVCGWKGELIQDDGSKVPIGETELYKLLYPRVDMLVGGYTVTNRAVSLTKYLGFARTTVAGAPFGWRSGSEFYAQGVKGKASNDTGGRKDMCDNGYIDGLRWYSRADMMASALDLSMHVRQGKVEILGDSMAASLARLPPQEVIKIFPQARTFFPGVESQDASKDTT